MKSAVRLFAAVLFAVAANAHADENTASDILVTFENEGIRATNGGFGAPYRHRKRYPIAAEARRNATDIASEYSLTEVDHWPIRSLSVYCFVYRIASDQDREAIIERLKADQRVESVQPLQEFETGMNAASGYNDTYINMQHGLDILGIAAAHRITLGENIRVAIVDSNVDESHEDLKGRLTRIRDFSGPGRVPDQTHGTAVASIIGARTNNAKGIAGIAPAAELELLVSCWASEESFNAVCDSFTLAKALDTLIEDPPQILNLSLTGPHDPLLARLLQELLRHDVVVVAAHAAEAHAGNSFPASLDGVIGVGSSSPHVRRGIVPGITIKDQTILYAPGDQIMVAIPDNGYDFRSGSSLAAAHVSCVVALLLAISPGLSYENVVALLMASQQSERSDRVSVNACRALQLADQARSCAPGSVTSDHSELQPDT